MNKVINLLLVFLIFISCSKKNESDLSLTIQNKKINFFESKNNEVNNFFNNEIEKNKGLNIIDFKITNNSIKNYFFIIDEKKLFPDQSWSDSLDVNLMFEILNSKNQIIKPTYADILFEENSLNTCVSKGLNYLDSLEAYKYKKLGLSENNIKFYKNLRDNQIILHPKESRVFRTVLFLPYVLEADPKIEQAPLFYRTIDKKEKYFFRISYFSNKININKKLQDFQIKNLKENNVEIFDGKLVSNNVSLRVRE